MGLALTGALQHPAVPGANAGQYCPVDATGNQYADCFDDSTAPTIGSTATPGPNANGWNNGGVTIVFTASDESGGSGVRSINCDLGGTTNGPTRGIVFASNTVGTTVTCTAMDWAGNVSAPASRTVRIDRIRPSIALVSRKPAPDPYGWNNTPVTVTWSCTDPLSGPVSPTVSTTVSTNGSGQLATGTCTDLAGNSTSSTISGINIDTTSTPPTGGPPNDNIGNAAVVGLLPFSDPAATTVDATREAHEPNCTFPENDTIWYRLTAPASGPTRISLSGLADVTPVPAIGVWRPGGPTGLQFVSCQVAALPAGVDVFNAQQGITYYIQIGSGTSGTGPFTVSIDHVSPPPNDNFENARRVGSLPFSEALDLTAATTQPGEPLRPGGQSTAPLANSAWYSFTPARDEPIVFGGRTAAFVGKVLAVYTGSMLSGLTEVAFSSGLFPAGNQTFFSPVLFQATAGTTYYLQIGATSSTLAGDAANTVGVEQAIVFDGQSPPPNAHGWNNTDVTLGWHCSGLIPFAQLFAPPPLTAEGANQSATATCSTFFNPMLGATDTESGINIDKTRPSPPTVAADRPPDFAGGGGWFKDVVTVTFAAGGDPNGANGTAGSGVDAASVPAPAVITANGSSTVSGTVKDLAGNESEPAALTVQVDSASPDISASFRTADGKPYTPGTWTNQAVTATFSCDDPGGSGVATTSAPQTVAAEGADQFAIGTCTDNVGHETVQAFGGIYIDLTPPEASFAFDPSAQDVVVTGTDQGGSGISGDPVAPAVVPGNGSAQTRTYMLADGAGNTLALVLQAKPADGAFQLNVTSTSYNGAAPAAAPFTSLAYTWNLNKDGSLKSLDQDLTVGKGGTGRHVLASFSAAKNTTTIVDGSTTTTRPGLVLVRVSTSSGTLVVDY